MEATTSGLLRAPAARTFTPLGRCIRNDIQHGSPRPDSYVRLLEKSLLAGASVAVELNRDRCSQGRYFYRYTGGAYGPQQGGDV